MQQQIFQKEITYLKDPRDPPPDLVKNFNIFLDDEGILKMDGRIAQTSIYEYEQIYPILLAKYHPLTELLITDCHERCKHQGINATLTKLRLAGFWVPQARQTVKKVISKCFIDKKFSNLAFKYPKITNLPKNRVNFIKPFKQTGIDYTGHVWVKQGENSKKMSILIFTCLNVRAIHIEFVEDMSTAAFVQALIRFSNIYGAPSYIYSDNATSFNAALGRGEILWNTMYILPTLKINLEATKSNSLKYSYILLG